MLENDQINYRPVFFNGVDFYIISKCFQFKTNDRVGRFRKFYQNRYLVPWLRYLYLLLSSPLNKEKQIPIIHKPTKIEKDRFTHQIN